MEVKRWLHTNGFDQSIGDIFQDNDIDMAILPTMTESDLKDIGIVSFGIRRKIFLSITSMNHDETISSGPSAPVISNKAGVGVSALEESSTLPVKPTCTTRQVTPKTAPIFTKSTDFNVKQMLDDSTKGEQVLKELTAGILTISGRQKLVQVMIAFLVEKCGYYPTGPQKLALAKAITEQFRCTKDVMPGALGHEHFYNNGHGFLEYRLKTIRTSLAPHMMRRTSTKRKATGKENPALTYTPTSDILEKVEFLKYRPPVQENLATLKTYFKDTHKYRQSQIKKKSPSVTQALLDWPRMRDMPELIDLEFEMLYPRAGSEFVTKWKWRYTENIIRVAKSQKRPYLDALLDKFEDGDSDLCALHLLPHILRTPNSKKADGKTQAASAADSVSFLIQNRPVGTDVDAFAKAKPSRYIQPLILGLGPECRPSEFYIICDKTNIPVGYKIVPAFDKLFKLHYALNLRFASPLTTFFNFFGTVVYQVMPTKSMKSQVRSINIELSKPTEE